MSTELATKHANDHAAEIRRRVNEGAPFGWTDQDDEAHYDRREDALDNGVDEDDVQPASAWNYLSDVLDIEYRVTSEGTFKSAELLVGFGGPNVWIDTKHGTLNVAWWSETITRSLPAEFIDPLNEAAEEHYGCL